MLTVNNFVKRNETPYILKCLHAYYSIDLTCNTNMIFFSILLSSLSSFSGS